MYLVKFWGKIGKNPMTIWRKKFTLHDFPMTIWYRETCITLPTLALLCPYARVQHPDCPPTRLHPTSCDMSCALKTRVVPTPRQSSLLLRAARRGPAALWEKLFLRIDNSGWSVNSSALFDGAGLRWYQRKYHALYTIRQPIINSIYWYSSW